MKLKLIQSLKIAHFQSFVAAFTLFTSFIYGAQAQIRMASDYGIYFAGANSITNSYGLYDGFFDHKGPLYYFYLRLIGHLFGFSLFGAEIGLASTFIMWVFSILYSARIIGATRKTTYLVITIASIATLFRQNTNGSIALFAASFFIIGISFIIRYTESGNRKNLLFGFYLIYLAGMTRSDYFALLPLAIILSIYFGNDNRVKYAIRDFCMALVLAALTIGILSVNLNFKLRNWIDFSIIFNVTTYREWFGGPFNLTNTLLPPKNIFILLFLTGFIPVCLYGVFKIREYVPASKLKMMALINLYCLLLLLFTNSDKDYHAFIVIPGLIVAVIYFTEYAKSIPKLFQVGMVIMFLVPALLSYRYMSFPPQCLLGDMSKCDNDIRKVLIASRNYDKNVFAFNSGWPFILEQKKSKNSFAPFFPILIDRSLGVENALSQFNLDSTIWVDSRALDEWELKSPMNFAVIMKNRSKDFDNKIGDYIPLVIDRDLPAE